MLKVIAIGDELPSGSTVREIDTFALNGLGQVAFFAYGEEKASRTLCRVATPETPQIKSIKSKRKKGALELRVNGKGMINNDSVIEINGTSQHTMEYPTDFREDGGTITRVVSHDPRLQQRIGDGRDSSGDDIS